MVLNANVLMVSRVIPVPISTNAAMSVLIQLEDIQIHVMIVLITPHVRTLKVHFVVAVIQVTKNQLMGNVLILMSAMLVTISHHATLVPAAPTQWGHFFVNATLVFVAMVLTFVWI